MATNAGAGSGPGSGSGSGSGLGGKSEVKVVSASAFEYLHMELLKDLFHPREGVSNEEAVVRCVALLCLFILADGLVGNLVWCV